MSVKQQSDREYLEATLRKYLDAHGDWEVTHGHRDNLVQVSLELLLEDSNDRSNWLLVREVKAVLDQTEDWPRWYA